MEQPDGPLTPDHAPDPGGARQAFIAAWPPEWQPLATHLQQWRGGLLIPGEVAQTLARQTRLSGFMDKSGAPGWTELTLDPAARIPARARALIWGAAPDGATPEFSAAWTRGGSWPEWSEGQLMLLRGHASLMGETAETAWSRLNTAETPHPTQRWGAHVAHRTAPARLMTISGDWAAGGGDTLNAFRAAQLKHLNPAAPTMDGPLSVRHWFTSGGQLLGHPRAVSARHAAITPQGLTVLIHRQTTIRAPGLGAALREWLADPRCPLEIRLSSHRACAALKITAHPTHTEIRVISTEHQFAHASTPPAQRHDLITTRPPGRGGP